LVLSVELSNTLNHDMNRTTHKQWKYSSRGLIFFIDLQQLFFL